MKKGFNVIIIMFVLLIAGCSKAQQTTQQIKDRTDAEIEKITENIGSVPEVTAENITSVIQQEGQTVYVPLPPQQLDSGQGAIYKSYKSSCVVERYKGLNIYCGAKNFWHNQATLLSWYIPYALVLLVLIIVVFLLWLKSRHS